ncbi:glycosyltransferase family 39 protein [Candidatus Parcubacteria bacterium]|nr:glycosyltransferase family 39 protein [Candidatus Parcubacteria bacterium]
MDKLNFLLILFYSVFVIFIVLRYSNKKIKLKIPNWLWFIPIVFFLITRFLPFAINGSHPLGYDTGFYNYTLSQARSEVELSDYFSLSKILHPAGVESIGQQLINKTLILLGFDNWSILYGFYILMGLMIGYFIYLFAKKYFDKFSAWIAVLLYSVSFVQFLAYSEMFWKSAVGLVLMLFIFYLLEQKKPKYFLFIIPCVLFLAITHKTSAIILLIVVTLFLLLDKTFKLKHKLIILTSIFLTSGILFGLNQGVFIDLGKQVFSGFKGQYDLFSLREGLFINGNQFLNFSFFYLPFALLTIGDLIWKKSRITTILLLTLVSSIFVIFELVFYKRIFIYLDISLIILASYSLARLFNIICQKTSLKFSIFLFSSSLVVLTAWEILQITKQPPALSENDMKSIQAIKDVEPDLKIFTYNSYYTPWLYGFSGHKIIAPGWGDGNWNLDTWKVFWGADLEVKKNMLSDLTENKNGVIIFKSSNIFDDAKDDCFTYMENNFYLFKCPEHD